MEENKFKVVLQNRVNEDKANAKKEQELREKYGIKEGRTVGVVEHKDGVIVEIWKVGSEIVKSLMQILIYILAAIGILSILHPNSREILQIIFNDTLEQIRVFAPFLPI